MPVINRPPTGIDNDDEHHKVIIKRQTKYDKDTSKNFVSFPIGSMVVVQHEDGGLLTHSTKARAITTIMIDPTISTSKRQED